MFLGLQNVHLDVPSVCKANDVEKKDEHRCLSKVKEIPAPNCVTQDMVVKIDALLVDKTNPVEISTEVGANSFTKI